MGITLLKLRRLVCDVAQLEYGNRTFFRWNLVRKVHFHAMHNMWEICNGRELLNGDVRCDGLKFSQDIFEPHELRCGGRRYASGYLSCTDYRISDVIDMLIEERYFQKCPGWEEYKVFVASRDLRELIESRAPERINKINDESSCQEESLFQKPERHLEIINRIIRDSTMVGELKQLYDYRCCLCDKRIYVSENQWHCEVHHLRPLGEPHNGPDEKANMMVLCPAHHIQFDHGVPVWRQDNVISIGHHEFQMTIKHALAQEYIDYYRFVIQQ